MIAPMEAQPRLASLDASMPWASMKARSLAVSPSIVIGEYLHVNEAVSERSHHPLGRTGGRIGGAASSRRGAASTVRQPHEHRSVRDVHVVAGDLHCLVAVAGAQGCHQRYVVAA